VQRRRDTRWFRRGAVTTLVLGFASCLQPTAGEIPLIALDTPAEKPLAFGAGTELDFAVHADEYEYSGMNQVMLDVTLLRAGTPVGTMRCAGFDLEGGSGCGSGATHLNSSCSIKVPAGGSDAVRAVATLRDKRNSAKFKGLSIYLRK
jgi:hypothetical protein